MNARWRMIFVAMAVAGAASVAPLMAAFDIPGVPTPTVPSALATRIDRCAVHRTSVSPPSRATTPTCRPLPSLPPTRDSSTSLRFHPTSRTAHQPSSRGWREAGSRVDEAARRLMSRSPRRAASIFISKATRSRTSTAGNGSGNWEGGLGQGICRLESGQLRHRPWRPHAACPLAAAERRVGGAEAQGRRADDRHEQFRGLHGRPDRRAASRPS